MTSLTYFALGKIENVLGCCTNTSGDWLRQLMEQFYAVTQHHDAACRKNDRLQSTHWPNPNGARTFEQYQHYVSL